MKETNSERITKYTLIMLIITFMANNIVFVNNSVISCISLLLMGILFLTNVIGYKKHLNWRFIANNKIPILFLVIQIIIIIFFRFSITSLSLFFNEAFFIFVIYLLCIKNKKASKLFYKTFIISTFILNIISIICCYLSIYGIINLTTYDTSTSLYISGIYSNPNAMGITTAISLMIYFTYFFKKKDMLSLLFIFFNLLMIYVSQCRTAILIVFIYFLLYYITKHFRTVIKPLITFCSISLFFCIGIYYGYMFCNKNQSYLNKYELIIDRVLTHRYMMSKYSILSLDNKLLIGIDHKNIASKRFEQVPYTIKREMDRSEIALVYNNNNNHNSYTQILVNLGLIMFILFLLIIIDGLSSTYHKNIPIIISILVISFFESEIVFSKGIVILMFFILLADKHKEKYISNCKEILYINYIDMGNKNSGSSVRPNKIYEAFIENGCKIKMLTGTILKTNKKERLNNIKEITKWLKTNKPKMCYIESPGEPIIYMKDRNLIRLLHYYDIPIAYFYRDCYYMFPKLYVFDEKNKSFKYLIKYLYNLIQYYRDIVLLQKNVDIVYFPSIKMGQYFPFENYSALPPGCNADNHSSTGNNLVYVGALSENYGSELLFKAIDLVNKKIDAKLLLVCRESEYIKYKDECKKYKWLEVYHVSGEKELMKIYNKAKIALLPKKKNKYNDFAVSVKFFEYLGYGLPVVATSCEETDKIIKDNIIGLVAEENANDFAKKIYQLYHNNNLYYEIKKNVKIFAKNNSWEKRVEQVISDIERGDYY